MMNENVPAADHLDPESCKLVAEFFAVLGNPLRVSMFCGLRDGAKTVSELAEHAGVSLQNASQHLRLMRDKGAVTTEKRGQHVHYSIADMRLLEGCGLIRDVLAEQLQRRAGNVGALAIGQE